MADRYFDGDLTTPVQRGPVPVSTDEETKSAIYERTYIQRAANFTRATLDSSSGSGPSGSYLVYESPTTDIGGGVVQWTRQYAATPADHVEYVLGPLTRIYIIDLTAIERRTIKVWAARRMRYAVTTDPSSISRSMTFKAYKIGGVLRTIEGTSTSTHVLMEDEIPTRWRGNIWRISGLWMSKTATPEPE